MGEDPNQMAPLTMMEAWQRLQDHEPSGGGGSAKALRKLHTMKETVLLHPKEVISEYLSDVMRAMDVPTASYGVDAGEVDDGLSEIEA